jgi:uncharacterized membrane protein
MDKITKSIIISAPLEQVFAYFSEPRNLPEIWPSLTEVKNFIDDPAERSFDYVYKMAGMKFEGHSETLEFEPNERIMSQSRKGIHSVMVYSFERVDDKTKVTIETEYKIPNRLLSKLAAPVIRRINEREATTVLNNLKDRMEYMANLSEGATEDAKTQEIPPVIVH